MKKIKLNLEQVVMKIAEVNREYSLAQLEELPTSVVKKAQCVGKIEILNWIIEQNKK